MPSHLLLSSEPLYRKPAPAIQVSRVLPAAGDIGRRGPCPGSSAAGANRRSDPSHRETIVTAGLCASTSGPGWVDDGPGRAANLGRSILRRLTPWRVLSQGRLGPSFGAMDTRSRA